MPAPAALFAPWLFGVIASAVAGLFSGLAKMFASKVGTYAVVVAAMIALASAFTATMQAMLSTWWGGPVPPILQVGVDMLPANTDECIMAIVGARIAGWLWRRKYDGLQARLFP